MSYRKMDGKQRKAKERVRGRSKGLGRNEWMKLLPNKGIGSKEKEGHWKRNLGKKKVRSRKKGDRRGGGERKRNGRKKSST